MTTGRAARNAIDPAVLLAFLDVHAEYVTSGTPKRRRLTINGQAVSDNDARVIRRWRAGKIKGVTVNAAVAMLGRHGFGTKAFAEYCSANDITATSRGKLPADN